MLAASGLKLPTVGRTSTLMCVQCSIVTHKDQVRDVSIRIIKRRDLECAAAVDRPVLESNAEFPRSRSSELNSVIDKLVISLALKAAKEDHDRDLKTRES